MCETKAMFTLYYTATAVFSIVTGGVLRKDTKNGCIADQYRHTTPLTNVWDWGYVHTIPNICLVCYTATAVFSVVTGGALRDDTKHGCVAD